VNKSGPQANSNSVNNPGEQLRDENQKKVETGNGSQGKGENGNMKGKNNSGKQ